MTKTVAEHFSVMDLVKLIGAVAVAIGGGVGVTSATSSEPELTERLAVVETRIDPLMSAIEENTKQMRLLIKSSDSLSIIVKLHIEKDTE